MSDHTPGPWRDEPTNSAKLSYVVVSTVQGSNGSTVVIGQCAGPDKEANARLIATAPALYELAEDAVPILEAVLDDREEANGEEDEILRDLLNRFRAALKAKDAT